MNLDQLGKEWISPSFLLDTAETAGGGGLQTGIEKKTHYSYAIQGMVNRKLNILRNSVSLLSQKGHWMTLHEWTTHLTLFKGCLYLGNKLSHFHRRFSYQRHRRIRPQDLQIQNTPRSARSTKGFHSGFKNSLTGTKWLPRTARNTVMCDIKKEKLSVPK